MLDPVLDRRCWVGRKGKVVDGLVEIGLLVTGTSGYHATVTIRWLGTRR